MNDKNILDKIMEIKEMVEGCCVEIQQVLLPQLPDSELKFKLDSETCAIDDYMTEIDIIITSKEQ